jgi:hypothetical protein
MIPPFRLLLIWMLLASAPRLAAQKFAYHNIPWDIPADSVRGAVRAQGFTFSSETDAGDPLFTREDGARLIATLRAGRLAGFTLIDPARGEAVDGRFVALADSLGAALGQPDEVVTDGTQPLWEWVAGLWSVGVHVSRPGGERSAQVVWRGPGWYDEMDRRSGEPQHPPGYTTVSRSPFLRMAVDTTVRGSSSAGTMRGRFRIAYFQPITPSVNGVEQDPLDVVEYEMDFDCAGRRTRLISRTTYLAGRRQGTQRPTGQPWTTPQQPDGHYARGLDAVCRARRQVR